MAAQTQNSREEILAQGAKEVDFSKDVVLKDDDGERIAAMREYVFLNVATASN